MQQHRDNWSRETVKSLRKRVRNLRAELTIQAGAYGKYRELYGRQIGGYRRGKMESDVKVRRIEETLSRMAQQNAWYREQFVYLERLLRSPDWRRRALASPDSYLDAVAWLAGAAVARPIYPDLVQQNPAPAPTAGGSGGESVDG